MEKEEFERIFSRLDKNIQKALKWAAAEFYYLSNMNKDLQHISSDSTLEEEKKYCRKAGRILRYLSRSERRLDAKLRDIVGMLKKAVSEIPEFLKLEEQIEVSEAELAKAFSFYAGDFKKRLAELSLDIGLRRSYVKTGAVDKDEAKEREIKSIVDEIASNVNSLIKWQESLIINLRKIDEGLKEKPESIVPWKNVFINRGIIRPEIYRGTLEEKPFLELCALIKGGVMRMRARYGDKWFMKTQKLRQLFDILRLKIPFMGTTVNTINAEGATADIIAALTLTTDRFFRAIMREKGRNYVTIEEIFDPAEIERQKDAWEDSRFVDKPPKPFITCFIICLAAQKVLGNDWKIMHGYEWVNEKRFKGIKVETHTFLAKYFPDRIVKLDLVIKRNNEVITGRNLKKYMKQKIFYAEHDASLEMHRISEHSLAETRDSTTVDFIREHHYRGEKEKKEGHGISPSPGWNPDMAELD